MTAPRLWIVTTGSRDSITGVNTHFLLVAAYASRLGINTDVLTPYDDAKPLGRKALSGVARLLSRAAPELAIPFKRRLLIGDLAKTLTRRRELGCSAARLVLYAQDPASALVALQVRHGQPTARVRVVFMAHFNNSEGEEHVGKGIAKAGGYATRWLANLERAAIEGSDLVLTPSRFMHDVLAHRYASSSFITKFDTVPNSTSPPETWEELIGPYPESTDLINLATLEPRKNQAFLVNVVYQAHLLGAPLTLTLVGDGPDRTQLENLVARLGLTGFIRFTGNVPNARSLLRRARVYVHSARMESFGISILEALAVGIPVFAAPVGGVVEVFTDGIEGRYWELDDPVRAASVLVEVLREPETYNRMSRAASRRYSDHFSSQVVLPSLLAKVLDDTTLLERGLPFSAGSKP